MERVIENNKLIAEFMGYEGQREEWCGNNILEFNDFIGEDELRSYSPDKRWDDIMPVVDKIKNNKTPVILLPKNGIDKSIAPYLEKCRPLSKALLKVDMEIIYNSVVDFIKWYNEYLLSTDKTKTV